MNNLVIYHHLGLGDHFICNGLVREWAARYDTVALFCKSHNAETVKQMYNDLNINFLVGGDDFAHKFLSNNKTYDSLCVGFNNLRESSGKFDKQFYDLAGVSFDKRWSYFKVCRNPQKEKSLVFKANLPRKFALVHEDVSRGFKIDTSKINLPIVRLEKRDDYTMIDWLAVADLAQEIHVIDSSFMFLIDSVYIKVPLYIHRYSRRNPDWQLPTLKKNWIVLQNLTS